MLARATAQVSDLMAVCLHMLLVLCAMSRDGSLLVGWMTDTVEGDFGLCQSLKLLDHTLIRLPAQAELNLISAPEPNINLFPRF